jgi:hypothetical protein
VQRIVGHWYRGVHSLMFNNLCSPPEDKAHFINVMDDFLHEDMFESFDDRKSEAHRDIAHLALAHCDNPTAMYAAVCEARWDDLAYIGERTDGEEHPRGRDYCVSSALTSLYCHGQEEITTLLSTSEVQAWKTELCKALAQELLAYQLNDEAAELREDLHSALRDPTVKHCLNCVWERLQKQVPCVLPASLQELDEGNGALAPRLRVKRAVSSSVLSSPDCTSGPVPDAPKTKVSRTTKTEREGESDKTCACIPASALTEGRH